MTKAPQPPDAVDLQAIRRVLVIKLRHHGDVLLASPVFQVLKNHAPHVEVDALIYLDTSEMLTGHPAISEVHTIDRHWKRQGFEAQIRGEWRLLKTLQSRRYDLLIHLTEHHRGAWLSRLIGPRCSVAYDDPRRGRLWRRSFTHRYPYPKSTPRHTVELNLDALRRIGIQPSLAERRLVLVPGKAAEQAVDDLLIKHGLNERRFIHIHPTSRWFFKTWPVERVAELCDALHARGERVVLTSAPDEREKSMIAAILDRANFPPVDLSGQLSLKDLAALTRRARLFIGVDSAPMHIAAAMQTPVAALFGPSGEIVWGPWMVQHRIIASNHSCRPCGNDGCGGGKISECLTILPLEQVLAAVRELS
ncbi:MAG: putative lipopolysaccharide heptosyltransferase III [Burkholderiales bacterium]|nr:putative lipopolysaccharide heptosyltransferase III [Burkholderiales bacterium]